MGIALTKDSIDLGIIVKDAEKSLAFYRDTLGFEYVEEMSMGGGTIMHRLMCGTSMIKLLVPGKTPAAVAPGGGLMGATGYRYWTISVSNLDQLTQQCKDAGCGVLVDVREIRPGVRIAIVEDPDGNAVEFIEHAT